MAEPNPIWLSFDRSILRSHFVCWCSPPPCPIHCCCFLIFFFPFLVASSDSLPTTTLDPPTAALKPSNPHAHNNTPFLLPITLSLALFLILLFAMAFLVRLFRRLRRKRVTNQVSGEPDVEKGNDCGGVGVGDESVRKFTWAEINEATASFSHLIGSGGFSNVFLARFRGSGEDVAVKVQFGGDRLNQSFKQELEILLRLRHHSIVKLLGFCDDQDEAAAMVFDYIPKGNLDEKLKSKDSMLLWRNRTAIAFQLAQAIEYLHENCSPQIVHGDIKASNVLLDEFLNCKLCDFGSAKLGFSSTVLPPSSRTKQQLMIGSPGYTDPHYLRTGIASKKNDVYSFGVIILELVTGKEAFCSEKGKLLTSIMEPILKEIAELKEETVSEIVDPRLRGEFELNEVKQMMNIAALCLQKSPSLRPSATQIEQMIKETITYVGNYRKPTQ